MPNWFLTHSMALDSDNSSFVSFNRRLPLPGPPSEETDSDESTRSYGSDEGDGMSEISVVQTH